MGQQERRGNNGAEPTLNGASQSSATSSPGNSSTSAGGAEGSAQNESAHDIGRSESESSQNSSTINTVPKIFLNCGAWHSGATDFAVVCNGDIFLVSWLPVESFYPITTIKTFIQDNPKLIDFIESANGQNRGFIRKMYKSLSREFKFTENEIFVFIGDCHIHLFNEWGPDGFVRDPDPAEQAAGKTRVSLFPEFKKFIEFCNQKTSKDKIIQIGDLYDFWESQNVFEGAANMLHSIIKRHNYKYTRSRQNEDKAFDPSILSNPPRYLAEYAIAQSSFTSMHTGSIVPVALAKYFGVTTDTSRLGDGVSWDSDYRKKWEANVLRDFAQNETCMQDALALLFYGMDTENHGFSKYTMPELIDNTNFPMVDHLKWNETSRESFARQVRNLKGFKDNIDFLSYSEIKSAIRKQYADESFWNSFTAIVGNHDMEIDNRYLKEVFVNGKSREEARKLLGDEGNIQKSTWVDFDLSLADPKVTLRVGKEKCIVCEHGHAWDPYNNSKNFDLLEVAVAPYVNSENIKLPGGFHTCRGWTVGDSFVLPDYAYDGDIVDAGFGKEMSWTELLKFASNLGAIEALEAGNHARAVAIYESDKPQCMSARLIVMGHSHNPRIDANHTDLMNKEYDDWKIAKDQKASTRFIEDPTRNVPMR